MKRINLFNLWSVSLALILGSLTSFCFAPYNYAWLMFPLIAGWLYLMSQTDTAYKALFLGWLFGIGFYGAGIYWVEISIERYGGAPSIVAWIITLFFFCYLALYVALFGFGFKKIIEKFNPYFSYLLLTPLLYVALEWLKSTLFTGFPWLNLGYAQIETSLAGYAPIFGVYGMTFFTLQISGYLTLVVSSRDKISRRLTAILVVAVILGGGQFLSKISWTIPGDSLTVEIVQGAVPQEKKWLTSNLHELIADYEQTTLRSTAQLVVWPEAAIPAIWEDVEGIFRELRTTLQHRGQTLILGAPYRESDNVYNGMIVYGFGEGRYAKRHLLPFGEYWPGRKWLVFIYQFLTIPMSDFKSGDYRVAPLIAAGHAVAPFICYEITYPSLMCGNFNAEMIVTISDDSWFGDTTEAAQHLQIARMRSLEFGRMQVFVTNMGISALVSEGGEIVRRHYPGGKTTLTGEIKCFRGLTPFAWLLSHLCCDENIQGKRCGKGTILLK